MATSPSRMAMNGYEGSPTRKSTSPTPAERSSPRAASASSCEGERDGLGGGAGAIESSLRACRSSASSVGPGLLGAGTLQSMAEICTHLDTIEVTELPTQIAGCEDCL